MSWLRAPGVMLAAAVLGLMVLVASGGAAEEKPNRIVAQVRSTVEDPARPFVMLLTLQTKDGQGAKLEAAMAKAIKLTLREKGCLNYDLSKDPKNPTQFVLYERWQNLPSLEAHLKARHITVLLKELDALLVGPPQVRVLVPVGK